MAEVDAAPAVSTSEAAPAPYDESLLIKDSKGKVKRPTKPDDTERNKQIEKLQEQITKYSERIKDIKATIESKRGSGRNTSGGTRDIIKRLQDLRNQFQSVLRQKQHIRDELNETNKSREDTRAQLRSIREKTNQTRVEDIEIKIHELEDKLRHDTLSVRDEKSIHDQISKLNAAKPLAKEHVILTERLQEIESIRTQIIERLKECDAVLNDVKAQETEERANLDKIKAAESGETSDVPSMHVEKQECYQIIVSLRDKITQIRNDFNDKYQEWVKLDKAYNAWNRHQKKLQYEERKKEREEREQQRQTVAAADLPDPYEAELISCDQMVAYLKRLQGSQEEVVASTTAADLDAPAPGMKLLRKKNDDELEGMFAGFAKKGKGAKKGGAEAKKAPSAKKLVHDLDTLKTFMMLKVDVPQTTAELAKACEAVTVRKAEFLKKREDAKNAPPPGPKGVEVDVNGTGPAGGEDEEEEVVAEEEHEKEEDGEEEGVKENGDVEVVEEGEEEKVEALARGVSVTLSVTDDAEVSVAVKVSEDAEA